jgi:hypothetical protein
MTVRRAQLLLLALFLGSLLLHLACFGYSVLAEAIYLDDLQKLATRILAIYSVPLGVIVGGIFGASGRRVGRAPSPTLWAAIALCVLWNVLLLSRTLIFALASQDSIASLLSYVDAVAAAGTFLIGAALAYYFAK